MKIKRILVPLDFSTYSDEALGYAFDLAERFKATLYAFHSIVLFQSEPDNRSFTRDYEQYLQLQEEDSRSLLARYRLEAEKRGILLSYEVRRGFSAAEEILQYADEVKADLIILGTHGRTGLKRWFYGSVSERIVRLSPHPVITVHENSGVPQQGKLLIPVDFSDHAHRVASEAVLLAEHLNLTPVFMHIVEYEIHPAFYSIQIQSPFVLDNEFEGRVIQRLQEFVDYTGDALYIVREGKAWNEIVEYAKQEDVAMIAMGTRGLTGLDHLLIGSTAERVARFSSKPVFSMRLTAQSLKNEDNMKEEMEGSH